MTGLKRGSKLAVARLLMLSGVMTVGLCSAPAIYAASAADCAAEADRASRDPNAPLGGAGRGALRGAALGGIIDGGDGAARGAAIGAIVGTARNSAHKSNTYNQVYDSCMRR